MFQRLTALAFCAALFTSGASAQEAARNETPPAVTWQAGERPAPEPRLEFGFSELVLLGAEITPGETGHGGRNIIPITGGTFEGPGIRGTILPMGWDWQLRRSDGCLDIEADYFLETDDGVIINIVNKGALCQPAPGEPFAGRTHPVFEAPTGKYEWLSRGTFIGTLAVARGPDGGPAVHIAIYRVR